MTYSIVARDDESGELGAAIQSASFACGVPTLFAESAVGIVATQSFTDPAYGPLCLDAMRFGATPAEALAGAIARDRLAPARQVGVVSSSGAAAGHTGEGCIEHAGHVTAENVACQANMMDSASVWPAMLQAFSETSGRLSMRLVRALEAAQAEGGDWRGQEAGRVLVVTGEPTGRPWDDVLCDVRVDNHPQPVAELRRLAERNDALRAARRPQGRSVAEAVELATASGLSDVEVALAALSAAREGGDVEEARVYLDRVLQREPRYVELARRLPGMAGMLGLEPVE
ncbi:MAG: DUF1028 domain-containing protein [Gaiellales bacterium]